MANKVRDYGKLAADIKDTLGEQNIQSATHCATRLRLVLKHDPDQATIKKIERMPAVIQVVQANGQFQIVIGTHAKDVYEALASLMHLSDDGADAPKEKQSPLNRLIAVMSGCIAPFVYVMAAAGLLQGILIVLRMFLPINDTGAEQIYDMISWVPFTFLPVFIGVAAAKHFKCNTFVALWCCMALVSPTWSTIATSISGGTALDFFGLPLFSVTYTSTIIPAIILVAVLAQLEHWLERHLPDVTRSVGVPLICAAIMVPLTILLIGPVSTLISNGLSNGYNWLYELVPWLASGVFGALWEVLVIFGVQWSFTPISLMNYENLGFDTMQACKAIAVCAQVAACFAVVWKSRNKGIKRLASSSSLTGLFGITEPAIYGVTLRLKRPFIFGCVGSAVGCAVASLFGARYFVYAGLPGILSLPNALYTDEAAANLAALGTAGDFSGSFMGVVIGTVIAVVVAFALVMVFGFDDPVEDEDEPGLDGAASVPAGTPVAPEPFTVVAPAAGTVQALSEVPDKAFSSGQLGRGVAVVPSEGKLYAPVDGTVAAVFETGHAIALSGPSGSEVLIHVGLETVNLKGEHFSPKVKAGDVVRAGDLLMEFDLDAIAADYNPVTPVLVTNADDFGEVAPLVSAGDVKAGDPLFEVR